jgi:hypothetical protein
MVKHLHFAVEVIQSAVIVILVVLLINVHNNREREASHDCKSSTSNENVDVNVTNRRGSVVIYGENKTNNGEARIKETTANGNAVSENAKSRVIGLSNLSKQERSNESNEIILEKLSLIGDSSEFVKKIMDYYRSQRIFSPGDPIYQSLVGKGKSVVSALMRHAQNVNDKTRFISIIALKEILGPEDETAIKENIGNIPELAYLAGKYNLYYLEDDIIENLSALYNEGVSNPKICRELFEALSLMKSQKSLDLLKKYIEKGPMFSRGWAILSYVKISYFDPSLEKYIVDQYEKIRPDCKTMVYSGFIKSLITVGSKKAIELIIEICEENSEVKDWTLAQFSRYFNLKGENCFDLLHWLKSNKGHIEWDEKTKKYTKTK